MSLRHSGVQGIPQLMSLLMIWEFSGLQKVNFAFGGCLVGSAIVTTPPSFFEGEFLEPGSGAE